MTAKEARKISQEMRESNKKLAEHFAKLPPEEAKKQAREVLVRVGICTKNGNLTAHYKSAKK